MAKVMKGKKSVIFIFILLTNLLIADGKLEFEVEKINIGICSAESLKKIKPRQYYHNFSFLGICTYSIKIKGSTDLPPGTWLIVGFLYNDLRLNQVNKVTTVEEDGTFKATLGVFKDDKKIFPGDYTIEVWYLPTRQDPDVQPKLKKFSQEIKATQTISIWDDTTNLPIHLEKKRLIKFYLHLLRHFNYLLNSLNNEFNKYFPQDMEKNKEGEKVKQEYKNAYKLYIQKQYDKIDYKKLCFKELCFIPNVKKVDFDPLLWSEFAARWKKTAMFFYKLAREARDNCLVNPMPEIAGIVTLQAEALLSYINIYEKRLYGTASENIDPLNPNPPPKGISVYKLYKDMVNAIYTTRNKILVTKDLHKPITLTEIIKNVHSIYKNIVSYIDNLRVKLKKEKGIKKIISEDSKFIKQQQRKLARIKKDIDRLAEFAKNRRNKTLSAFSSILNNITSHLDSFLNRRILDYRKYIKPNGTFPHEFLESFRIYRNSFLLSLKNLLESMGNQELYLSLNLEEEIKDTSLPAQLTNAIEKEIDEIFNTFKTEQQNPDLFTKSYLSLKNYDKLVIQYILKNNTLDSKFRYVRIYSLHYLMEQNAIGLPDVEKLILKHIEKWFDDETYTEELGYAYEILTRNPDAKYLDILHRGLTHKDAAVRAAAIITIIKIGSPKSFNYLLEALKDESAAVRGYAKEGLETLLENPIELDVKTINPKTEEGGNKINALIEKLKKEWQGK